MNIYIFTGVSYPVGVIGTPHPSAWKINTVAFYEVLPAYSVQTIGYAI